MRTRLVFTAYNRPQYFNPVMASWTAARWFAIWPNEVFLEPSSIQDTMADIAHHHGAQVHFNPTRYGVLSNPWHALEHTFTGGADFAVLAEDDVLVSDDILEYFTFAARAFRNERVLAVCAASFAPASPPEHTQQLLYTTQFCPLVWGTWADRWTNVLRDTWDHDYSSGTPEAPQSGWDWNINLRLMRDWHIIAPAASRSTHIGKEQGVHTTADSFPGSVAATFTAHRSPAPFTVVSNR